MKKLKFLSIGLALTLVFNNFPMLSVKAMPSDNGTETSENIEGEVDEENYVEINTVEDFLKFTENCYIDSWSNDKIVMLKSDISLDGVDFNLIPVFSGTFDGGGHTISGFNSVGDGYVAGLFRYVERDAVVENLKLKGNIAGTDEKECIGSICGINYGTIKNCSFQGTISGSNTIGGIVGTNETTGVVTGCSTTGRIIGYYTTGGVVGRNHGDITNCTNRSNINDNSEWVEEDDEKGTGLFFSLNVSEDETDIHSGIDTGGIVGYSDGFVSKCSNYGRVGYEHTGYNIGGIAGRQTGIVSLCTNYGEVYGRKDIGGIVGQMEPDIEVDAAESLKNAVNKLHDLIDKTLNDMHAGTDTISSDFDNLGVFGDAALESGDDLVGQMSDFVDENIGQTQQITARMEHVFDMFPEIADNISYAGDSFKRVNDILSGLADDLNISDRIEDSEYEETDYRRLTLLSTVGGRISSSSLNPDADAEVTITITPDNGYKLDKISAVDADGNELKELDSSSDNERVYIMSEANAKVEAYFIYGDDDSGDNDDNDDGDGSENGGNNGGSSASARMYAGFNAFDGNDDDNLHTIDDEPTARAENMEEKSGNGESQSTGEKPKDEESKNNEEKQKDGESKNNEEKPEDGEGSETEKKEQNSSESNGNNPPEGSAPKDEDTQDGSNGTKEPESGSNSTTENESETENTSTTESESNPENTSNTETKSEGESETESMSTTESESETESKVNVLSLSPEQRITNVPDENEQEPGHEINYDNSAISNGKLEIIVKKNSDEDTEEDSNDEENNKGNDDVKYAEAGDEVIILPKADADYILDTLSVKNASGSDSIEIIKHGNGTSYSFIMPDDAVTISAEFKEIQLRLTSGLSGNASYSVTNDGTVTLRITPDSGYTVSSTPSVHDNSSNNLPITKKQSGSFVYEFNVNLASSPITVKIDFTKQDKKSAVDTSADEIQDSINDMRDTSSRINDLLREIEDLSKDSSNADKLTDKIFELLEELNNMSSSSSSLLSNLSTIGSVVSPYIKDAVEDAIDDIHDATDELQTMIDYLKSATRGVRNIVNYINAQPDIVFSTLGDEFDISKDALHSQLQGISDVLSQLNEDSTKYSEDVNVDLKAVNDQLNVVFNLLADHLTDYNGLSIEELYEEVPDDEIEFVTTGRTDACNNKGIVKGDINIGGIAGSMSIDDEDPEDNAAGNVEYQIGQRYITKCIISDSTNEGYITAKRDGAGGIVGYMQHGIVVDSEGYGSVESTEGNYVGGICGESLTIIKRCYALCSASGIKNVGGIAGYANTLQDCYAIVSADATDGRKGAIAGQVTSYNATDRDETPNVYNNYYVGDDLFGIDNISYTGMAEPISYTDLLTVDGLPNEFWHLKVVYRIEDTYLGSQEVKYGESLANLNYPDIPAREGFYGKWPDYSDRVMTCNLIINGEYLDDVIVVESNEKSSEKPYALVEQIFTQDTELSVEISNMAPPAAANERENIIYDISLKNGNVSDTDTFAVRLLNPYGDDAEVWGYLNDTWTKLESKARGQYLQVDMTGPAEAFCIIETKSNTVLIIALAAAAAAAIVILAILFKILKKQFKGRKLKKQSKKQNKK